MRVFSAISGMSNKKSSYAHILQCCRFLFTTTVAYYGTCISWCPICHLLPLHFCPLFLAWFVWENIIFLATKFTCRDLLFVVWGLNITLSNIWLRLFNQRMCHQEIVGILLVVRINNIEGKIRKINVKRNIRNVKVFVQAPWYKRVEYNEFKYWLKAFVISASALLYMTVNSETFKSINGTDSTVSYN